MWQLNTRIRSQSNNGGFTLLEMLLVLVIASAVFVMLINYSTQRTQQMRLDKATLQVQQVLNAAMAFYVNNSKWPSGTQINTAHELVAAGYLPPPSTTVLQNPWGRGLRTGWASAPFANQSQYYVTTVPETESGTNSFPGGVSTNARIIAGRMPMGFVTDSSGWYPVEGGTTIPVPNWGPSCAGPDYCDFAVGSVTIPGQNLNNARSVNFASVYSSGGCVPAPSCPDGMIPQILVVPASVSGTNDGSSAGNLYAITSFTAFAVGSTVAGNVGAPIQPPIRSCSNSGSIQPCYSTSDPSSAITSGYYWRVCLSAVTEKGLISPGSPTDGQAMGSIMAITRCTPSSEPSGSAFSVWSP